MSKAAETRLNILRQAFQLVYVNGYQSTSIDDIIAKTLVTKGAFFYHFKNKDEMGLAMIEEVMYPGMYQALVEPLLKGKNPVDEIYLMMKNLLMVNPIFNIKYGCPAINLIEEMSPLNDEFKESLSKLVIQWENAIERTLKNGKAKKKIRKDVNIEQVCIFIMTGYGGIRNLGKIYGIDCYSKYLKELKAYLKTLE